MLHKHWNTLATILGLLLLAACSSTETPIPPDVTCSSVTEIPQAECQALLDLYNATDGHHWKDSPYNNWGLTTIPCINWSGVKCRDGHVISIVRAHEGLSGVLPGKFEQLANLHYLQELDLHDNQLTGAIPPELGNLTHLEKLLLNHNQLTGAIPVALGNLVNLQELDLNNNELTGAIPPELGNLTSLEYLCLNGNYLTGAIPPELGNLTHLEDLRLCFNQLSGAIPPELGNLTHLEDLSLSDNQLSGAIPPELGNLTYLEDLTLSDNQLTGAIPPELGNLTYLEDLTLSDNHLTGAIPPELGNLAYLKSLFLSGNQLTGAIPSTVGQLADLRYLQLDYNGLLAQDSKISSFLNSKAPKWADTQTIPPAKITATRLASDSVQIAWQPISYSQDGGYYQVHYSRTSGGPYTPANGVAADKTANSYIVEGLTPGTGYYFVVTTFTPAHDNNANAITSTFSSEATAGSP